MQTETRQPSDVEHILLTSLGTQLFDAPTAYELDGKPASAFLAPLALVQLLDHPSQRPNRVVTMVTPGAESTTWPVFEKGICRILGFKPKSVLIPDGRKSDEIRKIIEAVAPEVSEGAELTLDVTQGFRHFPFIFYALSLYLTSLRSVKIRGAYYGLVEGPSLGVHKPIIDLQPLLELPEWFHAVRMFRDYGTTEPMATLLKPLADELGAEADQLYRAGNKEAGAPKRGQANDVKNAVDSLKKYAFAYESALPLELGKAGRLLSGAILKLPTINPADLPPLAKELTDTIASVTDDVAFVTPPASGLWKTGVILDMDELNRQAGMINLYLDRGQLLLAVGLMREWVVSWAILKSGKANEIRDWLVREVRSRYETHLGTLGSLAPHPSFKSLTKVQREFITFWNQLTARLRNTLHHHGMREEALEEPPSDLAKVQEFWNQLKNGTIASPLGGHLLLSPQGTRPGVLFSALKIATPNTCLVICSDTSKESITEAAKHADFSGPIEQITLTDPHGGFAEIDAAVERAYPHLLIADEVVANMTGGTTLMGLIVQRLAEEAQKLDRPVRRFALIDRRAPAEQNDNPFVEGECYWLDLEQV